MDIYLVRDIIFFDSTYFNAVVGIVVDEIVDWVGVVMSTSNYNKLVTTNKDNIVIKKSKSTNHYTISFDGKEYIGYHKIQLRTLVPNSPLSRLHVYYKVITYYLSSITDY